MVANAYLGSLKEFIAETVLSVQERTPSRRNELQRMPSNAVHQGFAVITEQRPIAVRAMLDARRAVLFSVS